MCVRAHATIARPEWSKLTRTETCERRPYLLLVLLLVHMRKSRHVYKQRFARKIRKESKIIHMVRCTWACACMGACVRENFAHKVQTILKNFRLNGKLEQEKWFGISIMQQKNVLVARVRSCVGVVKNFGRATPTFPERTGIVL